MGAVAAAAHTSGTEIRSAIGWRSSTATTATARPSTNRRFRHTSSVAASWPPVPSRPSAISRATTTCTAEPGNEQDHQRRDDRRQRPVVLAPSRRANTTVKITASALLAIVAAAMPTALSVSLRASVARSEARGSAAALFSRSSVSRAVRSHVKVAARVLRRRAHRLAQGVVGDQPLDRRGQPGPVVGQQAGDAIRDRLRQPADAQRHARRPHVAASITVRHQPSAEDAVTFSHACA